MSARHGWRPAAPAPRVARTTAHQVVVAPRPVPRASPSDTTPAVVPKRTEVPEVERQALSQLRAEARQKKASSIKALRPPKPIVRKRRSFQRPSLSDQLASIGNNASKITSEIQTKHGLSVKEDTRPLLAVPSTQLVVGKLQAKHPSPVRFMPDRVIYHFMHPFQSKEISMEMFYRDMCDASLDDAKRIFSFRIPRELHHFGDDYNPDNYQHRICIGLGSSLDCDQVKTKILPLFDNRQTSLLPN